MCAYIISADYAMSRYLRGRCWGGGVNPTGRITSCLPPPSREDVAPADGGPGLPGRRPALPASDGAVEALPGPALLPLAVRLLVRVPRGGLSGGKPHPS